MSPAPGVSPPPAGTQAPDGSRQVFRLPGPLLVWWLWVAFAVANLINIALTGRNWGSVVGVAVFALITGLAYTMAWRPRVVADEHGIIVQNPLRDHRVPWGAVSAVAVGESVQVRCSRGPDTDREKVVHSWALAGPRRAKINKEMASPGGRRRSVSAAPRQPSYGSSPSDPLEVVKQNPVYKIAADLDRQAKLAQERGAPPGERVASWPWPSLAAVLIPLAALLIVLAAR